ncbi:MFS transporter [Kribbella sp. NBC_00889]|uniref:MFS transporter n=1 Tax=Kribbella sp. NBC_00889 TaxID=2975974 RepID=UPI003868CCCE|nr:MFS transporter [Kribbella sp. NBC_00889]
MRIEIAVDARPRTTLLGVLAVCSAVGVGTVYFPQALLPSVAASLHVPLSDTALVVTAPQAGYAVGILTVVPLGDTGAQRRLLTILFAGVAVFAIAAAAAPSLPVLVIASFLMGCATVASPVIGPYVAGMTGSRRLGSINSILLSVGIPGMILSRAIAGFLGEEYSWRYAYLGAAVLALVCATVAWTRLPVPVHVEPAEFPQYLRRPFDQLRLRSGLRRSAFYQACTFAGFTGTWATLVLVLQDSFGLGAGALGWISLVAIATMAVVPWTGRIVDRRTPDAVTAWILVGTVLAAVLMLGAYAGGALGLTLLVAGVLVLDVSMQSGMVANVTRMYQLDPGRRSAMNTAYMVCAYSAGSLGSWTAVRLYHALGWWTVPTFVAALASLALLRLVLRPDSSDGGLVVRV